MVGWRLAQGSNWQARGQGVLCGSAWALEFPIRIMIILISIRPLTTGRAPSTTKRSTLRMSKKLVWRPMISTEIPLLR